MMMKWQLIRNNLQSNLALLRIAYLVLMQLKKKNMYPHLNKGRLQTELKALIEHSDNDKDRGNAIYLLANSNDYIRITHYLLHYISDSSSLVRNNAMRVLSQTLMEHEINDIDITPFLIA